MPSVLATGCDRGIGLEWVRQYAEANWRVYATCRRPAEADALHAAADAKPNISVHRLDVTRADEVAALAAELQGQSIDVLVNNAGVYLEKFVPDEPLHISSEDWALTFAVNTMAPVRITEAFVEHLSAGERRLVVATSSHMGSIADIDAPGSYYYRSSKAALNAAMKGVAAALRPRGIGVLVMHPGWVKTRMGGPGARITVQESVAGMRQLVDAFTLKQSGRFLRYDGVELPW